MLPNRWSFSFSACADFDCSSLLPPYIMYYNIGLTICQHFMQRSIEKHPSCDRCFSERYAYEIKYIHQMATIWCNRNGRTWTLDTLDISQLFWPAELRSIMRLFAIGSRQPNPRQAVIPDKRKFTNKLRRFMKLSAVRSICWIYAFGFDYIIKRIKRIKRTFL